MKQTKSKEKMMQEYMVYLRQGYDELCKTPDLTTRQRACREVAKTMFDGLTYGLNEFKLNWLGQVIESYRQEKLKYTHNETN